MLGEIGRDEIKEERQLIEAADRIAFRIKPQAGGFSSGSIVRYTRSAALKQVHCESEYDNVVVTQALPPK